MRRQLRLLLGTVIVIASCSMYGCDGASGIGVGVPMGGARWGGGTGPGVIVMGGPVY